MTHKTYTKVVLIVLDGFGVATYNHGNAVALANPETLNFIVANYPSLTLQASGPLVGLPWGEVGNSEVGHLNIGAGRIVGQDLPRINSAISDHSFFKNQVLLEACEHVVKNNSKLHLIGMISPGGVHSSDEHLYALLGLAAEQAISNVYIHMFTDGRDTPEKAALDSLQKLRARIATIGVGKIATITGRFYAMDRGKHWDQTFLTYQALVHGSGSSAYTAEDAILDSYNQSIFDEMIKPTVLVERSDDGGIHPVATIGDNDAVVYFNFRSDRALQLTQAFVAPEMTGIEPKPTPPQNLYFATMTEYFFGLPAHVAFPATNLQNNLAEFASKQGLKQFHIAESEKYAHVTSFFNGGTSEPYPGEERVIVTSPNNAKNYSDHPEMSGLELTDVLLEKITTTDINLFIVNYASPDMVGHTGNLQAAIKAVQYIDRFLQKIMQATLAAEAVLIITADHGNVEEMINLKTGEINKDHTTNPVPFLLVANEFKFLAQTNGNYLSLSGRIPQGVVSDVAPTILDLFGLEKPSEMNGINLFDELGEDTAS
jgi:2,3-bisphosphoglycerate-independent phosphoglycerate mutase